MSQIDTINTFYDHQIRTYGLEAMNKINSSTVLIYGLAQGLGTELGKNLTLAGIKHLYLYDNYLVNEQDLITGYYYSNLDYGKSRSDLLTSKLQDLNPLITVKSVNDYKQNQQVTIVINQSVDKIKEINDYCRSKNTKMIVLWSKGVSGVIFVDAGENHLVIDKYNQEINSVQISQVTETGTVQCVANYFHDFHSGDTVTFTNLEGTNLDFLKKEWRINVINKTSFQLEEFNLVEPFVFINGTVDYIKKPIRLEHQPWSVDVSDLLVKTYLQMYTDGVIDKMPPIWTTDNDQFMLDHQIQLPLHARLFHYELIPIVSIFGSLVASETIKLITNKYRPISQWFSWTDDLLIPKDKPINYDQSQTLYGTLYGLDFENKLINSNWLVVGLGSVGIEHLKNLALMNVKNVIMSDSGLIRNSDLNSQFLFRSKDLGKFKSGLADQMIKQIRPDMKITPFLNHIGLETIKFTDSVLPKITGVLNTLNNQSSKKFIDEQCFKYNLPLFDCETSGLHGKIHPVIPFVTETYSISSEPKQEKSYPLCVLKSFPNEIGHTLHWAMEQFEFFSRGPKTMNQWLLDPSSIDQLEQNEKIIALEDINLFTVKYPTQLNGLSTCISWAIEMFNEHYYHSINKLLETFPHDHQISENVPFWSAGKRCPKPVKFDSTNQDHLHYVEATTHLLANCSGVSNKFSLSDIFEILESVNNPTPQDKQFKPFYVPQEFNHEDDTNWHVKWIMAASNMRATNYSITKINYTDTKYLVGKINPTIITTSTNVSGLCLLEMLKYLLGYDQIDQYKLTSLKLTEPSFLHSVPQMASMIEVAGVKVNSWTKFEYTKDTTLNEFKLYYEKVFETSITMIVIGTTMIYADFLDQDILNLQLSTILCDHFKTKIVPNNISFNLLSNDDKEIPIISVNL